MGYGPWGRKESAMTSTHGETKIQRVKTNKQISVPLKKKIFQDDRTH